MADPLDGRCGTCARFVRVAERISPTGEVTRAGECLLGVWSPPLFESNTCSQYIRRGTVRVDPRAPRPKTTQLGLRDPPRQRSIPRVFPPEVLDMDADEFRQVLRDVLRDELGLTEVELGGRWQGGELILKPGKESAQEKRFPIEALFRKIVGVRDKLRVLEQKLNTHPKLTDEDKVQLQQYITSCYGTLTTFNILFANREDGFVGQKGDKDD